MMKVLPAIAAGFLLMFTGILHGLWTDRWSELIDLAEPVQRLENLPGQLGDWEAGPLEKLAARPAGLAAAVTRRYVHRVTGKAVTPFVLSRIKSLTGGRSLATNIALVKHNAEVGAKLAVALAGAAPAR